MSNTAFCEHFEQLTGNAPYPWQVRLFDQFVNSKSVAALDIPTGLGKTSVIAIWLLAHLLGEPAVRPPMRLVYVVNRRTIVDQASEQADRLRKLVTPAETTSPILENSAVLVTLWRSRFHNTPLSVSTLRGALADNREWMRYPHCPSIIIGTVDMIGSRLLFGAYRAGRWTQGMHAGLLGQDALVVHDEAHLSEPFQSLLEWIRQTQLNQNSPRALQVLSMSATGQDDQAGAALSLDAADLGLAAVQTRIHARKTLVLHESAVKQSAVERLADLAIADEVAGLVPKRVIVFVRTPKTAGAVMQRLKALYKVCPERIELLTGTIRGYERDKLVKTDTLKHLLDGPNQPPLQKSVYLISTSAGEVGADFDADHLVCDIAPLNSMIQRLGRVNRRGGSSARVDLLIDIKAGDKHVHAEHMVRTAEWLKRLPGDLERPDAHTASPQALRDLREADNDAYRAAIPSSPKTVEPHPVMLDAWAMTSIQEDRPIAPPLDVYLHGLEQNTEPQTSVAWRDELSLFLPPQNQQRNSGQLPDFDLEERRKQFADWLDVCPLRPREIVSDKSAEVMSLLCSINKRTDIEGKELRFIRIQRREIIVEVLSRFTAEYESKDKNGQQGFCREKAADQTFIFPSEFGGLSIEGRLDVEAVGNASDVADAGLDKVVEQTRIWLPKSTDADVVPLLIGNAEVSLARIVQPDEPATLASWRDAIVKRLSEKLKLFRRVVLDSANGGSGWLLLFKPRLAQKTSQGPVELESHNEDVGEHSAKYAKALVSSLEIERAIEVAGRCHDLGKDRPLWQASVRNTAPEAKALAKSFNQGMNPSLLRGYRHEFGSAVDALVHDRFQLLDPAEQDLALHLITVHHGRARPDFPEGAFNPGHENNPIDVKLSSAQIACRYARLQRRFGHWGLAWIESLVMCADHNASRGELPEDE